MSARSMGDVHSAPHSGAPLCVPSPDEMHATTRFLYCESQHLPYVVGRIERSDLSPYVLNTLAFPAAHASSMNSAHILYTFVKMSHKRLQRTKAIKAGTHFLPAIIADLQEHCQRISKNWYFYTVERAFSYSSRYFKPVNRCNRK